jgi:hypothetical protein
LHSAQIFFLAFGLIFCWNDAAGREVDQACIIILIQVKDLRS